jgi:hypothetical protein
MRATRLQDGWARLEFVPQLQHGDNQQSYTVADVGWKFQNGQQSETLFQQRFEIKLGTGDMAVITAEDDAAETLGQLFFRGPAALRPPPDPEKESAAGAPTMPPLDYPIQRLLIVRLAGVDEREPGYSRVR